MKLAMLVVLPLVIAYGDTLKWIWDRWMTDEYYSHGPILPILAAVVIYRRRNELLRQPAALDLRGWWLLGLGLFLRLFGAATMVDSVSAVSLILTVCGAVWLVVGTPRLRLLLPVLLLLIFATPPPLDFTSRMAVELKEFAIGWSLDLGNALGLGAERQGASIKLPGQEARLEVADACSGLRSLLALTTLGYVLAFFFGSRSIKRRVILLAVAMPIAVLVNILRIVGVCFFAKAYGVPFAGGTGHLIMNGVELVLALGLLFAIDVCSDRAFRRQE